MLIPDDAALEGSNGLFSCSSCKICSVDLEIVSGDEADVFVRSLSFDAYDSRDERSGAEEVDVFTLSRAVWAIGRSGDDVGVLVLSLAV